MKKLLKNITIIAFILFVASLIVYFFNLDMKMSAKITPILDKYYDNKKRDKKL